MLGNTDAVATIGVRDLKKAEGFYGETLGLDRLDGDQPGVCSFKSGDATIFVYESQYAGTNQATSITWVVEDVDSEVKTLREKGVAFEHYNLPRTEVDGDVHVSGDMRMAWFKDPDGNILALVSH